MDASRKPFHSAMINPTGVSSNVGEMVRISLRKLVSVLASASQQDLAWVQDFEDDEILVSSDLNDVVQSSIFIDVPNRVVTD